MAFILKIETDNAAFEDWQSEVARILNRVAAELDRDPGRAEEPGGGCTDINGNTVGFWQYRKEG
jgi:hypothetical protein